MTKQLCQDIETALSHKVQTPKDFEQLRERIYARLHILMSRTTLMRLWGYIDDSVKPSKNTLNTLAQFLGYKDYDEYLRQSALSPDQQSSPVMSRRLSVAPTLAPGDRLCLTWLPDRVCDVEYLGNLAFRVLAAQNTRLHSGDTFQCSLIIEGEPLYLDNLVQGGAQPTAYVCGKKAGVRFEYIK
jgi:hypothetical protein